MTDRLVEIALPLALRHTLTYRLPGALSDRVHPGSLVRIPLGSKTVSGVVLGDAPHPSKNPGMKLKDVIEVVQDDLLTPAQVKLLRWASAYYITPIGEVLKHLAPPEAFGKPTKKPAKPRKVFSEIEAFHVGSPPTLNREQEEAYAAIEEILENPGPPILLHGITGSGKTEVYLRAARSALERGGQALILVPEIGLTPQLLGRFRALGEGDAVAVYHSGLTNAQRRLVWSGAREERHRVIVATRSGIFLPMPGLKLIVVDEEHDTSYKQEERFCYHARDLALWRASEEKLALVLGSATPSLESLQRSEQGKMRKLRLDARPSGAVLPEILTVDRRRESERGAIFSPQLLEALEKTLSHREQALLFVNRRGFAPFVLCPSCGHVPMCDQCDVALSLHRTGAHGSPILLCHYCDESKPYTPVCPSCEKSTLALRGFGTEKVASELAKIFPKARIARLDRDSAGGGRWLDVLEKMKRREIDVLVGTQMITKGHDYPHLTLVGILDADVGLHLPDFRAAERTYQIVTQVAGRAGRADRRGRVLIQTYRPGHESLVAAAAHDGAVFSAAELENRREAGYPPFNRLIEIRLAGKHADRVRKVSDVLAIRLAKTLSPQDVLLGPAPCPIETVRGQARWHVLIKTTRYARLQPQLAALLDDFERDDLPSTMKMLVNVDPIDMM